MNCKKCSKELVGLQRSFCSKRCGKSFLESERRKRLRSQYNEYNRQYRKKGMRHLTEKDRRKVVEELGSKCERCEGKENLDLHHIKQLRFGGTNNKRNLLLLCESCHQLWHKSFSQDYWDLSKSQ